MDFRAQKVCAWSGVACVALFIVGFFVVADFVPPPAPGASAEAIGDLYRAHQDRILLGMVIAMAGAGLSGPWVSAITMQLKRIEGGFSVLTLLQFSMGTLLGDPAGPTGAADPAPRVGLLQHLGRAVLRARQLQLPVPQRTRRLERRPLLLRRHGGVPGLVPGHSFIVLRALAQQERDGLATRSTADAEVPDIRQLAAEVAQLRHELARREPIGQ